MDYQAEAGRYVTTGEKDSQQKNKDCISTSTNNFVPNISYDNSNVINSNNNSNASVNKINKTNTNTNNRKNWSNLDNIKVMECYFSARKGSSRGFKRMGQW